MYYQVWLISWLQIDNIKYNFYIIIFSFIEFYFWENNIKWIFYSLNEIMQTITTNKIVEWVAIWDEIILRNNQTTRLVFKPMLLDNVNNIKWTFIFQKKWKNDEWEDINEESLSRLKKWEGYQLKLSSEELSKLLTWIEKIQKIYEEYWIQDWKKTFYVTDENIEEILNSLWKFDWKKLKEAFKKTNIKNIENTINIAKFEKVVEKIENNLNVSQEKFWQKLFEEENWVLSQIFAAPYIYYQSQAYLWWKDIHNAWWIITDYFFKNNISENISIIEIKNPHSKLIEDKLYRWINNEDENSVYSLHKELTGAISQILNQKNSLLINYDNLKLKDYGIKPYNVKSILIIWTLKDLDETQRKTFELHRQNYKDLEIITFDELLEKIRNIYNLLNDNYKLRSKNSLENEKDSLPF